MKRLWLWLLLKFNDGLVWFAKRIQSLSFAILSYVKRELDINRPEGEL